MFQTNVLWAGMIQDFTADDVFDELSIIADPEKAPLTLTDLDVISRDQIQVRDLGPQQKGLKRKSVVVWLKPTVPHCHFMLNIALAVRLRLQSCLPTLNFSWKIFIHVVEGSHLQWKEIEKQVNDKERVAAAMENRLLMTEIQRMIDPGAETA